MTIITDKLLLLQNDFIATHSNLKNPGISKFNDRQIFPRFIFPNVGVVIGCPALFQLIVTLSKSPV